MESGHTSLPTSCRERQGSLRTSYRLSLLPVTGSLPLCPGCSIGSLISVTPVPPPKGSSWLGPRAAGEDSGSTSLNLGHRHCFCWHPHGTIFPYPELVPGSLPFISLAQAPAWEAYGGNFPRTLHLLVLLLPLFPEGWNPAFVISAQCLLGHLHIMC